MGNSPDTRDQTKLSVNLLVGFENKSLTICYANSILQVMFHHPVFVDIILHSQVKKQNGLVQHLKNLYKSMLTKKENTAISSLKLMNFVQKESGIFQRELHQDCHEFYIWLMNTINDEIKGENKKSVTKLEEQFFSKRITRTQCLNCKNISQRQEEEVDLSLVLPEPNVSLNYCIQNYSSPQKMTGHDKFKCDSCENLQNAQKRTLIKSLPNFLSVHLRRFKYDQARKGITKLTWLTPFPFKIKIKTNSEMNQQKQIFYQLVGVVAHIGKDGSFGHYICYVKIGKQWYLFNDDQVNEIDDFMLESLYGYKGSTKCAYMLFYTL